MNTPQKNKRSHAKGFTLVELLTVIAIIGILATILIPTVGNVLRDSRIAKGKAQLQAFATAIKEFEAEYSYWPTILDSNGKSKHLNSDITVAKFQQCLSGMNNTGTRLGGSKAVGGNKKALAFLEFAEAYFNDSGDIVDPLGSTNIYVVIDSDRNGLIPTAQLPGWASKAGDQPINDPTNGLKASVALFVDDSSTLGGSDTTKSDLEYATWD